MQTRLTKFLRHTGKQGRDGFLGNAFGLPTWRCEHEEQAQSAVGLLSDDCLVHKGGTDSEAQTNDREISRCELYTRERSLRDAVWRWQLGMRYKSRRASVRLQLPAMTHACVIWQITAPCTIALHTSQLGHQALHGLHPCCAIKFSFVERCLSTSSTEIMWMKRCFRVDVGLIALATAINNTTPKVNVRATGRP